MSNDDKPLDFKVYLSKLCSKAQFQNCSWRRENRNSLGCESNPWVDMSREGALGRLSLVFFLGVGVPLVLQKLLFTEAKIQFPLY